MQVVFSKIYNLNFNLGDLKLVIDEKEMPQIKILKTSVGVLLSVYSEDQPGFKPGSAGHL